MDLKEFKKMAKRCLQMWDSSLAKEVSDKIDNDAYTKKLMQRCDKTSKRYLLCMSDSFVYLFRYGKIR